MPPTAGGRLRVSVRTGRRTRRPRARRVRPTIVRSRDPAQAVQATDQRGTRLAFMPIVRPGQATAVRLGTTLRRGLQRLTVGAPPSRDRKSTRLNSSHPSISYAVFCLKKKNLNKTPNYSNQTFPQ